MKTSAGILVCMVAVATVGATSWKTLHGASSQKTTPHPDLRATTQSATSESVDLLSLPRAIELPLLGTPLRPGDLAPDFDLSDQNGRMHRLSDLRGRPVVLAFYPRDSTYTCAVEALAFDQNMPAFQKRHVKVFSVSVQSVASKALFAGRFSISYPLLADSDKTVARDYRVLTENGTTGRVTFVIGTNGRILWTDQNVQASTNARDVLRVLDDSMGSHSHDVAPPSTYSSSVAPWFSTPRFDPYDVTLTPSFTAPYFDVLHVLDGNTAIFNRDVAPSSAYVNSTVSRFSTPRIVLYDVAPTPSFTSPRFATNTVDIGR